MTILGAMFAFLCTLQAVQDVPTSRLTRDEIEQAVSRSFGTWASPEAVRLIEAAELDGQLAKFGATKSERLAAGIAAIAATQSDPDGAASTGLLGRTARLHQKPRPQYSRTAYNSALASLGRLVVNSHPTGATVTVDGYKWDTRTDADGYAAAGTRRVVVSDGKRSVGVRCDVAKEAVTTLKVDLDANTGGCSAQ